MAVKYRIGEFSGTRCERPHWQAAIAQSRPRSEGFSRKPRSSSSPGIRIRPRANWSCHPARAAAHGLPCIGAGWGPAEDGELESAGAAAIAATPADVVDALEKLS